MVFIPSLLDISVKTVFDNVDKYDKKIVQSIFAPLQQKMLHELMQKAKNHRLECDGQDNHIDKTWEKLPFLVNSRIYTKLDTYDLTHIYCNSSKLSNARFQEFIRCLGSNTPNLTDLNINGSTQYDLSLEERELASIIQLENLLILKILFVRVPLSGILEISHQCQKLESLTANYVTMDMDDPSRVTFTDNLRYVCIDEFDSSLGFFFMSMETTVPGANPKKRTRCINLSSQPRSVADFSVIQLFAAKLTNLKFGSARLSDIEQMNNFPDFPRLPRLKCAEINCGGKSVRALRGFFSKNGDRLRQLALRDIDIKQEMSLGEIFSSCPNLQSLGLNCCSLLGNDAPVDAMRKLKRFLWKNLSGDEANFSSILSAPLLEYVYIDLPKIDFSDNATVIARIERREILRNLKKFDLLPRMELISEDDPEHSYYLNSFNALKKATIVSLQSK
ncbi:Hypothetical predicted protein [Cloeon dipterum]|nr:Hypothetical predicted protein [Cloeon dipterum]